MNNSVLKNAFIDAFYEPDTVINYRFSLNFQNRMERLINTQKGFYRLVNTVAKRVACVILVITISLTAVACSVKEIREPILKEIKEFFVNASEQLKGTSADEVSHLFPQDVTKIIATDYISESKRNYTINEEEKVKEFITLISETYFRQPEYYEAAGDYNVYWSFDFYNADTKIDIKMKMCDDAKGGSSRIVIEKGDESYNYYISYAMYRKILSFTNRELYLHDSALDLPTKEFCQNARQKAIAKLSEEELKSVKKAIRHAHYAAEITLLDNVSLLKSEDSVYWEYFISGEQYTDPITHEKSIFALFDDYEKGVYKGVLSDLKFVIKNAEAKEISKEFEQISELWEASAKEHNLEGLFLAHEYIHDYDYFLYNYPTHYVYNDSADMQGIYDYFGHIKE